MSFQVANLKKFKFYTALLSLQSEFGGVNEVSAEKFKGHFGKFVKNLKK